MPFDIFTRQTQPLSVLELNNRIKSVVDGNFRNVYVTGEISDISSSKSKHIYFSLKDETSVIKCVIWQSQKSILRFELQSGLKVTCSGDVRVYAQGGNYSLNVKKIDPLGEGELQRAFKTLQAKLEKEGLFSPERKKPIPAAPRRVAVVTSLTGAAIRDFVNTMRHRTRRAEILICPVLVQGDEASREIASTLDMLNAFQGKLRLDAIALIRGGGSLEDLWAFNEERTARAIANSKIPVVSGIGHEFDVSISDMVADLRALTPTHAADCLFPDDTRLPEQLSQLERRLENAITRKFSDLRIHIDRLFRTSVFQSPADRLLRVKLMSLEQMEKQLYRSSDDILRRCESEFSTISAKLEALSPLAVLSRGYSITFDETGGIVRNVAQISVGQNIQTRVKNGRIKSSVIEVSSDNEEIKP